MPLSDRELTDDIKRGLHTIAARHRQSFVALDHALGIAASLAGVLDFFDHPDAIGYCQELDQAVREVIARARRSPIDIGIEELMTIVSKIGELKVVLGAPPANEDDEACRQGEDTAWSARQLAQLATRLLPSRDRARYVEEFRSELWDLVGAGRWQQILYAARQLLRAVHLRSELKAPHRSKAPS